jgi:hypothetical protein
MQKQLTGTDIWLLVDGRRSVEDIASELSSRYDLPLEDTRRAVLDFVASLLDAGVVAMAGPTAPEADQPPSQE